MGDQSVLVVAFDGADKEIIEETGLNNLIQEEYGTIDNDTDISSRYTTELFVSFITGTTHNDHGVKGLGRWDNKLVDKFENFAQNYWGLRKFAGLRKIFMRGLHLLTEQVMTQISIPK